MSEKSKEEPEEIKVILIGDSGVGKTNLINTSVGLEFDDGKKPTISGSFIEKIVDINGKKYSINLWDTAGQEAYRGVTKLFFKGSDIVILVYDITNIDSFKSLEEWFKISKEIIDNKFIYGVVGNKNDLYLQCQVKEEDAQNFAKTMGSKIKIVSAKEDPQSFVDFLIELVKEFKQIDNDEKKKCIKLKEEDNEHEKEKNCCMSGKK